MKASSFLIGILLLYCFVCMVFSCSKQTTAKSEQPKIDSTSLQIDILKAELALQTLRTDSLLQELIYAKDSIDTLNTKLAQQDSLVKFEDWSNRYKLLKIQRYLDIVKKRPSNKVYFYGWIRRTMEQ